MSAQDKDKKQKKPMSKEQKSKWLRFGGLVALTVAVIVIIICSMVIAKSCEDNRPPEQRLNIGETYTFDNGTLVLDEMKIFDGTGDNMAVFVHFTVNASSGFKVKVSDFRLEDQRIMKDKYDFIANDNGIKLTTENFELGDGESKDFWLCFEVKKSMKSCFLTYKEATYALGSLVLPDGELRPEANG